MMTFAFDLISDLHVEDNPELDWQDQATSRFCLIAGDVSKDVTKVRTTLKKIGDHYESVFYIDGNNEHYNSMDNLMSSYPKLHKLLARSGPNSLFLRDKVVIINDVAILAANGWYSFDYLAHISVEESKQSLCQYMDIPGAAADWMKVLGESDVEYLTRSVSKLQKYIDVKKIIIMTHTPPLARFVEHDPDLADSWRLNTTLNIQLSSVLAKDTEKKIKVWCFGHYHWPVDETVDGVRYVCNPLGKSSTPWYRSPYFAKRIEI